MQLLKLDGHHLKHFFHSGMLEVNNNRKYMNAINVFPIADGDTGTNLTVTLKAMVEKSNASDSFSDTAKSLSRYGLAHARGNSGIIFVSYINGLAVESNQLETVDMKEFAHIANRAVAYAYQAVEIPVEGTMISVMREWSNYLIEHYMHFETFNELLLEAFHFAEKSLEKTTDMLAVLKKSKVVDAGAFGFVGFLKGINHFLTHQSMPTQTFLVAPPVVETYEVPSHYRFCTEGYMTHASGDPDHIKNLVRHLGDSLIVTQINDQIRVHMHTNQPETLFQLLKTYGKLKEQKVEDMILQHRVQNHQKSKIAILTDSIADLPDAFKLEHQIHTLPLSLMIDEVEYFDKQTIALASVFDSMLNSQEYPTSSLPSPLQIEEKLNYLNESYDHIVIVTVSSQLSGTFNAVKVIAESIDPSGERMVVIDSRLNSGAQGLIVREIALALEGGSSFADLKVLVQQKIQKSKIFVCLETFKYAVRSGRVPKTIGNIAMLFGARPIMTLDSQGKGAAFGLGFSQKQITKKILKLVSQVSRQKGIESYSIVHTDNPRLAQEYKDGLTRLLGMPPVFISEISSVTAIHSGIGSVAVSFIEK